MIVRQIRMECDTHGWTWHILFVLFGRQEWMCKKCLKEMEAIG